MPQANRAYWKKKIARNALRDRTATAQLRKTGWRVLRIWGHSLDSSEAIEARITSKLMEASKRCKSIHALHERTI
jgi:G:T-mismatch repair DNA endonuclease (very short patch repair protein)